MTLGGEGIRAESEVLARRKAAERQVEAQFVVLFAHLNNPHKTWREVARIFSSIERKIAGLENQHRKAAFLSKLNALRGEVKRLKIQ